MTPFLGWLTVLLPARTPSVAGFPHTHRARLRSAPWPKTGGRRSTARRSSAASRRPSTPARPRPSTWRSPTCAGSSSPTTTGRARRRGRLPPLRARLQRRARALPRARATRWSCSATRRSCGSAAGQRCSQPTSTRSRSRRVPRRGRYGRFWGNHDDDWRHAGEVEKHLHRARFGGAPRSARRSKVRVRRRAATVGLLFLVHGHQGTATASASAGSRASSCARSGARCSGGCKDGLDHAGARLGAARARTTRRCSRGRAARRAARSLIAGHTHRPVFGGQRAARPSSAEPPSRARAAATTSCAARCARPRSSPRLRAELEFARRRAAPLRPRRRSRSCRRATSTPAAARSATATSPGSSWRTGRSASCAGSCSEGAPTRSVLAGDSLADVLAAVAGRVAVPSGEPSALIPAGEAGRARPWVRMPNSAGPATRLRPQYARDHLGSPRPPVLTAAALPRIVGPCGCGTTRSSSGRASAAASRRAGSPRPGGGCACSSAAGASAATTSSTGPSRRGELIWHPRANPGGMFDVRLMRDLVVITAAGVGGGSLVYANVQLRAPAEVFEDRAGRRRSPRATLEPWYDAHRGGPRAAARRPPSPRCARCGRSPRRARGAGRQAELLPIAVHFGSRASTRSAACPRRAARTSAAATSAVRCTRRTPSTSPTSRAPSRYGAGGPPAPRGASGSIHRRRRRQLAGRLPRPRRRRRRAPSRRPMRRAGRRARSARRACCSQTGGGCRALARARHRASRATATRSASPSTRRAERPRRPQRHGPVMTSELDYTADRRLIVADGGLPPGFDGILDVARGVNVIRGWRRWLVRLRDLLARRRLVRPAAAPARACGSPSARGPTTRTGRADLPDDRPRRRGRADAADAAAAAVRHPLAQGGSAQLFDDLERTAKELAEAAEATLFYALEGGPLGKFMTVHPLGGCPMGDDPRAQRRRRRRSRPRLPRPRTCSTGRSSRLRSASTPRRRSPRWRSAASPRARREELARARTWRNHIARPALPAASDRASAVARRRRRGRRGRRSGRARRARGRRRPRVVGRRADRRLPAGDGRHERRCSSSTTAPSRRPPAST